MKCHAQPRNSASRRHRQHGWTLASLLFVVCTGCRTTGISDNTPTVDTRPSWLRLASLSSEPDDLADQWNAWGREHLQSGDVIFIMGNSRALFGLVNFSEFSEEIAESRFSHVGIVSIEDGVPFIYDIVTGGPRRKELGWYLTKTPVHRMAFRRPRPKLKPQIPGVIEFCQRVYANKVPFDERLVWGDEKYYCCEFVEEAYRSQGIKLSELLPASQLPNIDEFSPAYKKLIKLTLGITPEHKIIYPGNDNYGLWSSSELTLLLPEQSPKSVPVSTRKPAITPVGHAL